MNSEINHLGLGQLSRLVPNKVAIKTGLALGLGAGAGIAGTDFLLSRVLVRNGRPIVSVMWTPLVGALVALVGGGLVKAKYATFGTGIIAGGIGIGIAGLIARYTSPATGASATTAEMAEEAGAGGQAVAGFGLGRAFAPGLGGLGYHGGAGRSPMLFGVGTPDMSASAMFNGATVAMEEGGPMSGASVSIETPSMFAGALQ